MIRVVSLAKTVTTHFLRFIAFNFCAQHNNLAEALHASWNLIYTTKLDEPDRLVFSAVQAHRAVKVIFALFTKSNYQ